MNCWKFFLVNFTTKMLCFIGTRMCRSPGKDFEEAHYFGRKLLGCSEHGGGLIPKTGHFHGNMIFVDFLNHWTLGFGPNFQTQIKGLSPGMF